MSPIAPMVSGEIHPKTAPQIVPHKNPRIMPVPPLSLEPQAGFHLCYLEAAFLSSSISLLLDCAMSSRFAPASMLWWMLTFMSFVFWAI